MKTLLDVIVPSFNNPQMLVSCLNSYKLALYGPQGTMVRYIIVNNGSATMENYIKEDDNCVVLEPGENLGWEGGLKLGLQHSTAPLVLFSNDDIRLVSGQHEWIWKMVSLFNDPTVGAVGPSSNFVMGVQNIFADIMDKVLETKFLIGFFMMVRRDALDKVGGVDDTLPGGDDIDLSIRLRDQGYRLLARRDVFVFHHGQVTGQKVHEGYWNSLAMQQKTNLALIKKHGMKKFYETMVMGTMTDKPYAINGFADTDVEGDACRKHVQGDKILELGCGGRKTVPNAIGIDFHTAGDKIPFVTADNGVAVTDIVSDASKLLPVGSGSQDTIISRHLLEHCQDPIGTLSAWNKAIKPGGTLIVAVPHNGLGNTMMMNPEHVNSFTPQSLRNLAVCAGFSEVHLHENLNGISFVSVFKKTKEPYFAISDPLTTLSPVAARLEEVCA